MMASDLVPYFLMMVVLDLVPHYRQKGILPRGHFGKGLHTITHGHAKNQKAYILIKHSVLFDINYMFNLLCIYLILVYYQRSFHEMNKQVKNTPVLSSHMLQKAATNHATTIRHEQNCLTTVRRLVFTFVNILKQVSLLLHNERFILVCL